MDSRYWIVGGHHNRRKYGVFGGRRLGFPGPGAGSLGRGGGRFVAVWIGGIGGAGLVDMAETEWRTKRAVKIGCCELIGLLVRSEDGV